MSSSLLVKEAWAAYSNGKFAEAAHLSHAALRIDPGSMLAQACHAMAQVWLTEETDSALRVLRRLVKKAPELAFFHAHLGRLYSYRGEMDRAETSFRRALELEPHNANFFVSLTTVTKYKVFDENAQRVLDAYNTGALPTEQKSAVCFALAKVFDDLGDYEQAMRFCMEGNQLTEAVFAPIVMREHLSVLAELRRSGSFHTGADSGVTSRAPLFVVGMPRSGTTLVETILGRHPDVRPCGEMSDVSEIEQRLIRAHPSLRKSKSAGVDLFALASESELRTEAEALLTKVERKKGGRFKVYTDKMPSNALRLGLIAKLFPNARVIFMRRNPLDCCISNLFANFTDSHAYTTRQEWLGQYFRFTEEVVEFWRKDSGLPILDVHYEDLVTDPERISRQILEFAGLKWDPAVLDTSRGTNEVRTASVWQARQPISKSSVERWRRYEPWIQPLIESLGGYDALGVTPGEAIKLAAGN